MTTKATKTEIVVDDCIVGSWAKKQGREVHFTPRFVVRPRGRAWEVLELGKLVCVTVYRRGAMTVAYRMAQYHYGQHLWSM